MKLLTKTFRPGPAAVCLFILLTICSISCSTTKRYSVANAHSHNDYLSSQPFSKAYDEGFGSIEADIFPVDSVLYVAHKKEDITPANTLKAIYLEPLANKLGSDGSRKLNLLIDVKENYQLALALLVQDLQPLMRYLSTADSSKNLKISISGERPVPGEYSNYPNYIFFDDDLKIKHSPSEWKRVSLVSLPFDKISKWPGTGPIPDPELKMLKHVVDTVHQAGKPFRFGQPLILSKPGHNKRSWGLI